MPFRKSPSVHDKTVLVIGLGRFGTATASSLVDQGWEVVAVDESPELVQKYADDFTHTAVVDSTDPEALQQIGVGDITRAIVAIGTDVEASVLTLVNLVDLGVQDIWAKAITKQHGRILERIGARHVLYPESAMGERVAHMISGFLSDYIEFDDGFAIARTSAPRFAWDKTLEQVGLRREYGVTVVGVKKQREDFTYARPETMVEKDHELVVCGPTELVENFSAEAARGRA
ncbi:potassium channel family protein [Demetria terragena]|uniref:potassium channel family protein n=1 Tax=Demetria terragena TaxID=63959 RepID=UPI00037288C1|nr:TrkA family potassium uptake protein [Demetria terragena]